MDVSTTPGGSMVDRLPTGTRVEVRNGFDQAWSPGFEVAGHDDGGYLLRRSSDGSTLPRTFRPEEVRRLRKAASIWWV